MLQGYVDRKRVAGTVTLILRDGKVAYSTALGQADVEKAVPMRTDTIFRIASQSKAVTTTAAMILVDEGKLLLNEPVGEVPAGLQEHHGDGGPGGQCRAEQPGVDRRGAPADHRPRPDDAPSGVSYGGNAATRPLYQAAGFDDWYFADKAEPIGVWIDKLATLPFDAQPGESTSTATTPTSSAPSSRRRPGHAARSVLQDAHLRSAEDEGHAVLPAGPSSAIASRSTTRPRRTARSSAPRTTGRNQGAYVDGPRVVVLGRRRPDCRPPATTPASCRCC